MAKKTFSIFYAIPVLYFKHIALLFNAPCSVIKQPNNLTIKLMQRGKKYIKVPCRLGKIHVLKKYTMCVNKMIMKICKFV